MEAGFLFSTRGLKRTGLLLLLFGKLWLDSRLSASDCCEPGSPSPVRSAVCYGLSSSQYAVFRAGLLMFMLDFANLEFLMFLHSMSQLGFTFLLFSSSWPGPSILTVDFVYLESSMPVRSHARLELVVFTPDFVHLGLMFSTHSLQNLASSLLVLGCVRCGSLPSVPDPAQFELVLFARSHA